MKRESPARGVESRVPRNGEAEAVRNAVGRESVAQAGTRSNIAKKPSARPAPRIVPRKRMRLREGVLDANGPTICTHRPPGAVMRKPGNS